eukprot:PhM_4_TR6672/c0_g1_i1/m.80644/K01578/MLYCD; malonyl-CoA decarboxylase
MMRACHIMRCLGVTHSAEAKQWFEDMWTRTLREQARLRDTLRPIGSPEAVTANEERWSDVRRWFSLTVTSGATSPTSLTASLCQMYNTLTTTEEKRKYIMIISSLGIDRQAAVKAMHKAESVMDAAAAAGDGGCGRTSADAVVKAQAALTPVYETWFHQVVGLPNGLQFLIKLRFDVLAEIERDAHATERIQGLHLFHLTLTNVLRRWFSVGWMHLDEVSWLSPAAVLESVVNYEAVHHMTTFPELRQRVGPTLCRRCYGYFHPALPSTPLVMIFVALTDHISSSVQDILHHRRAIDEAKATTAVFYSISSTQKGLKGIDLGQHLIKGVVDRIRSEFPNITTFTTLSPIPGLVAWLRGRVEHNDTDRLMSIAHYETIANVLGLKWDKSRQSTSQVARALVDLVAPPKANEHKKKSDEDSTLMWWERPEVSGPLEAPLMQLVARYLSEEKRRGKIFDPVANFHVRNGACIHRVNYLGNSTAHGCQQGMGLMVNYLYDLDKVVENAVAYEVRSDVIVSDDVKKLL